MKKLFAVAALLMATTSAHAGNSISFDIGGHKVRIEAPKNCDTLSCLKVSAPGLSAADFKGFKSKHFDDGDDVADHAAPTPQAAAPVAAPATAPQPAPAASAPPPASTAVASSVAVPAIGFEAPSTPAASPAPSGPNLLAAAPIAAPATPLGIWSTEEGKGNVRIESCGPNLCGYAVKTGEKILINMRPQDSKWTGQIHDPDSGRNYDSTIAMKGPNALRVQGCAFGGLFCGGQTWQRIS